MKFNTLLQVYEAFPDTKSCLKYLERMRWGTDVCCPHCGCVKPYKFKDEVRFKCKECKLKFNARTGTIFENSKIPLRKWFISLYLLTSLKRGISSHQLSRDIGVTQKTAWFMLHRLREMCREKKPVKLKGTVISDETFVGGKNKNRHYKKRIKHSTGRSFKDKTPVVGMLEKGGRLVTQVIPSTSAKYLQNIILNTAERGSILQTDEWHGYSALGKMYVRQVVDHSKYEYARDGVSTNAVENAWSHLKRGIYGTYYVVSRKHLQRYCDEYTFRFNTRNLTNQERFDAVITLNTTYLKYAALVKED